MSQYPGNRLSWSWLIRFRIPVQRSPFLFCLFSEGMSGGALSPHLIHLLPLVCVTHGDPGTPHPWLTSTPSGSPANASIKKDCVCLCASSPIFLSLYLRLWVRPHGTAARGPNWLKWKVNLLIWLGQYLCLGARGGWDLPAGLHLQRARGKVVDRRGTMRSRWESRNTSAEKPGLAMRICS